MKHTPGPWTVNPEDTDQVWGTGTNAVRLAQAIHWPKHDAAANALLIAAAPELLAACEAIVMALPEAEWDGRGSRAAKLASAAIAKATGEPASA